MRSALIVFATLAVTASAAHAMGGPKSPADVACGRVEGDARTVTWHEPAGGPIHEYQTAVRVPKERVWTTVAKGADTAARVAPAVAGLQVRVRARNGNGWSQWSKPVTCDGGA